MVTLALRFSLRQFYIVFPHTPYKPMHMRLLVFNQNTPALSSLLCKIFTDQDPITGKFPGDDIHEIDFTTD